MPFPPRTWPAGLAGGEGEFILIAVPGDGRPLGAAGLALKRWPDGAWTATDTGLRGPGGWTFGLPAGASADDALAWLVGAAEAIDGALMMNSGSRL